MKFVHSLIITAAIAAVPLANAGFFEASSGASYNRSDYERGSYSWSRKVGASIGYNFSDSSTFELSWQKSFERTHYTDYEDSFYYDEVVSLNWVQNLLSKQAPVQPYFKLGIGQLNRDATIILNTGQSQHSQVDSVTGVAGAGIRIYLTKAFALRMEGTGYLVGGRIRTWNENFALSFGGSIFF